MKLFSAKNYPRQDMYNLDITEFYIKDNDDFKFYDVKRKCWLVPYSPSIKYPPETTIILEYI